MKQLREHFEPIRDGLEAGESYLLMYRSKPLGTLLPYEQGVQTRQVLTRSQPVLQTPIQAPAQPPTSPTPINNPIENTAPSQSVTTPPISNRSISKFGLKQMLNPR